MIVCVCYLPPAHVWQNDPDRLRANAQKVDPGEENSPVAPAGIRTRDLSITSPAL